MVKEPPGPVNHSAWNPGRGAERVGQHRKKSPKLSLLSHQVYRKAALLAASERKVKQGWASSRVAQVQSLQYSSRIPKHSSLWCSIRLLLGSGAWLKGASIVRKLPEVFRLNGLILWLAVLPCAVAGTAELSPFIQAFFSPP